MVILIILGYVVIGIIEIIPLIKKGEKKELVVYSIIFISSFIISILLGLGFELPSPATPIENVIKSIIGNS